MNLDLAARLAEARQKLSSLRARGVVSIALFLPLLFASNCQSRKTALLDPIAPDAVGALDRNDAPLAEATGTWNFSASIDSWRAHYGGAEGPRLTIHAFLFTTPSAAHETYEVSRRRLKSGGGGFTKVGGAHVAGIYGMRMTDDRGEYFEFHRGCWVLILEGSGEIFEEAVRAIRWAPAQKNG